MMCSRYCAIVGILVMIYIKNSESAVFIQPAAKHPDHPGKCFDKLTSRPLIPGKEYKPKGICAAMTCEDNTFNINVETCPYIEMPECTEIPVDPTRTFPKCCTQFLCTDDNGKQYTVDLTS